MNKKDIKKIEKEIFKKGSNTFFTSSLFFSRTINKSISTLYAFVRTVDDFIDSNPQKIDEYNQFKQQFLNHYNSRQFDNLIILDFIALMKEFSLSYELIQAFFNSMEMDLYKKSYETIGELKHYIYGTAEVIGLIIAKILKLPENSHEYAKNLGKALQWINCIRDISEDISYGRVYIPLEILKKFSIERDAFVNKMCDPKAFSSMIQYCIYLYYSILESAEKGYELIPFYKLLPIKTASDMYKWTAKIILKNPMIVFEKKVKPSKMRIFMTIINNFLFYQCKYSIVKKNAIIRGNDA